MSLTAETITVNRPLLPRDVAERWGCSERHVRNLIRDGKLGHFRVGDRLLRIPAAAVEEYERRQTVEAASTAPLTAPTDAASAIRQRRPDAGLMRALARRQATL